MKIGVIGAGRLGICFALLAESAGHDVYVSDVYLQVMSINLILENFIVMNQR